jgi:DNA-binding CsgD family transcriptional regulator
MSTLDTAADSIYQLSDRECEILVLIAEGATNPEIAQRLFISTETVKSHVRNILIKLGARSRANAVALAIYSDQLSFPE